MKLNELMKRVKEPIPTNKISVRKQGGAQIKFISWPDYCDLLDDRVGAGNWSFDIREVKETSPLAKADKRDGNGEPFTKTIGARLFMVAVLTIYGEDRNVSYTAAGEESLDCGSFGDPLSNASAMALRRCCALAGLGRSLWQ